MMRQKMSENDPNVRSEKHRYNLSIQKKLKNLHMCDFCGKFAPELA